VEVIRAAGIREHPTPTDRPGEARRRPLGAGISAREVADERSKATVSPRVTVCARRRDVTGRWGGLKDPAGVLDLWSDEASLP